MKNAVRMLGLVAIFLSGSLFAQDSLQVQKRNGFKYKNQYKTMNAEQIKHVGFVDLNGDGFNDNAPDIDGDGIPNGQDSDYEGAKARRGGNSRGFVDADGDGINDNALDSDGDGIPNGKDADFVRPMDGTGSMNGKGKGQGIGTQDCTGSGSATKNSGGKRKGGR